MDDSFLTEDLPLICTILAEGPISLSGGHGDDWIRHSLRVEGEGYVYTSAESQGGARTDERVDMPDTEALAKLFTERPGLALTVRNHLADRLRLERRLTEWVAQMRAGTPVTHRIDLSRSLGGSVKIRLEASGDGFVYRYTPRKGKPTVEELADVDALRAFLKRRADVLQYL